MTDNKPTSGYGRGGEPNSKMRRSSAGSTADRILERKINEKVDWGKPPDRTPVQSALINRKNLTGQSVAEPEALQGLYPWSRMSRSALTDYMKVNPKDPRMDWVTNSEPSDVSGLSADTLKHLNAEFDFDNWESRWMVNDTVGGLARWFQGGRRLVDITENSLELLMLQNNRINEVPLSRDDKPWRLGYMFKIHDYLIYVEPAPSAVGRGVHICGWFWTSREKSPEYQFEPGWVPVGFKAGRDQQGRRILRGYEMCDMLTEESERIRLAYGPHGIRINMEHVRHAAINAFATLHALPDVRVLDNPKKKGRRNSTVGGVRGVKRLTLNAKGTRISMTRWSRKETEKRESCTRTVGLHHVGQHHWRVWVNTPKAHEHVMATRTKTNSDGETYTQFRVRRLRGPKNGYARGSGPMRVKKTALVTGIDDPGGE